MFTTETLNTLDSALKNAPIELTTLKPVEPTIIILNHLLKTLEKDNSRTYAYNVAGMKIKCEENFVNRTESMYLIFSGKGKVLDKELTFEDKIYIDTNTYDRYDWNIKNGILYVTLYEKINPRPDFKRIEKPVKKAEAEEENK